MVDNGSTDRTRAVAEAYRAALLPPLAIRHLVARLLNAPPDVQAVAGSVLVRNSRDSLWTRMQEWDYFPRLSGIQTRRSAGHRVSG